MSDWDSGETGLGESAGESGGGETGEFEAGATVMPAPKRGEWYAVCGTCGRVGTPHESAAAAEEAAANHVTEHMPSYWTEEI